MMADYSQPTSWAGARDRSDWSAYTLLFGRICFAADFLLFGSRKFSNPSIIYKLIEAHHLPGALVYPTIVLQLGCGLLVLLGLQTRLAAAALGWFCIVAPSIFWLDTLEHLSRDYAAAGGFMLLVLFGPGPFSLDRRHGIRDVVVSVIPTVVSNQTLIDRVMLVARTLIAFPFLADVVKKIVHFVPQRALFEAAGLRRLDLCGNADRTCVRASATWGMGYAAGCDCAPRMVGRSGVDDPQSSLRPLDFWRRFRLGDCEKFLQSRRGNILQGRHHSRRTMRSDRLRTRRPITRCRVTVAFNHIRSRAAETHRRQGRDISSQHRRNSLALP
jgi:putative oxidoreductase